MSLLPSHLRREMALADGESGGAPPAAPLTSVQHERRLIFKIAAIIAGVCVMALLLTT